MSRLQGTLINGLSYDQGREGQARQVDLSLGGQYGYQPNFDAYVSNTGYRPQNIIALLLEAPRGFQFLPNPEKSIAVLKALIENQSKQITGLNRGLEIESSERPFGAGGHQQNDPTNVTETQSTPTHVWDERHGSPVHNFWEYYVRNLIAEPITKQPGFMNQSEEPPTDHLTDMFTFTTLYIEPDPLRRHVVAAWLSTQMYPTEVPSLESQKDPTTGQDVPEVSIEMNALTMRSRGVDQFAQEILDGLNYINAGPMQRPSFVENIQADIEAAEQGYRESLNAEAETGVDGA